MGRILFLDRYDAGAQLAAHLAHYQQTDTVVFAVSRGGILISFQIAQQFDFQLDIIAATKLHHPTTGVALAAVCADGQLTWNQPAPSTAITTPWSERELQQQLRKLRTMQRLYHKYQPPVPATGRTAIIIDDYIDSGLSMRAALRYVRAQRPARLIVAAPIARTTTIASLAAEVDEVIIAHQSNRRELTSSYRNFPPIEDKHVLAALKVGGELRTAHLKEQAKRRRR